MKTIRVDTLPSEVAGIADDLSPRQREVLCLVARGYERRQIESKLHLRPRMVSTHLARIYEKTNVYSLQGLQARLGVLQKIPLPDGRIRLGARPTRRKR